MSLVNFKPLIHNTDRMNDQFFRLSIVLSFCDRPVSVVCSDALEPSGLVSPSSTVRSLTRELQHSLDLASATSGDKVVTAQVSQAADAFLCIHGAAHKWNYI